MDPADALIAIAHYLPKKRRCFKMGREHENPPRQPIYDFFSEQQQDFPDLLKDWLFSEDSPHPRSVNQTISNFRNDQLVAVFSSYPCHYHFDPICDYMFEQMRTGNGPPAVKRHLISDEQDLELQELSKRFDDKVACPIIFPSFVGLQTTPKSK